MATTTVNFSALTQSNDFGNTLPFPFRASDGVPYIAYARDDLVHVAKGNSATPTSFTEQDSGNAPAVSSAGAGVKYFWASQDGSDTIWCFYVSNDGMSDNVVARTFSMSTDTWGAEQTIAASVTVSPNGFLDGAIDANGVPHVAYLVRETNMGTGYDTVRYANRVGGSWNTPVEIVGASTEVAGAIVGMLVDGDNYPMVVGRSGTTAGVFYATTNNPSSFSYHSLGALSSFQRVVPRVNSDGDIMIGGLNGNNYLKLAEDAYTTWTTISTNAGLLLSVVGDTFQSWSVNPGSDVLEYREWAPGDSAWGSLTTGPSIDPVHDLLRPPNTTYSHNRNASGTDISEDQTTNVRDELLFVTLDYAVDADWVAWDIPTPTLDQDSFRFRNDDGTETTATWKAAANTNVSVDADTTTHRVRFLVQETAGVAYTGTFKLQANTNGEGWLDTGALVSGVYVSPSSNVADGTPTTQQLGAGSFSAGVIEENSNTSASVTIAANGETEIEWVFRGTQSQTRSGDIVQLRMVRGDGTPLDTYTNTPSVTISGPVIDQDSFRFRNDDGTETTATWKAAANTNVNLARDANFRVRFLAQTTLADLGLTCRLQYKIDAGAWAEVSTTTPVKLSLSSNFADGTPTTQQLGAGTFDAGSMIESSVNWFPSVSAGRETEVEYCLQIDSAQVSLGSAVQLRVVTLGTRGVGDDGTFDTYTNTPSITIPAPTLDQDSFRFRNDDGTESTATWIAAANTNVNLSTDGSTFPRARIRFLLQETGGAAITDGYTIQYRHNAGAWGDIPTVSSGAVSQANSPNFVDLDPTTQQLGAGTFVAGDMVELSPLTTGSIVLTANAETELEGAFNYTNDGLADGDTVEFRVVFDDGTPLDTYTNNPTVTFDLPVVDQDSYRFRNDDGTETTATWIAAANTTTSIEFDTNFRLRYLFQNAVGAGASAAIGHSLQYRINGGGWSNVTNSSDVRFVTSANIANDEATTQQLGAGTFTAGLAMESSTGGSTTVAANVETEHEYSLRVVSGGGVSSGDTIEIRSRYNDTGLFDTYTNTASFTVATAISPDSATHSHAADQPVTSSPWNPNALFAGGEEGAWYDPNDLSTVWTDIGGTIAATTGDRVARIDASSGSFDPLVQSVEAERPFLRQASTGAYYLEFDNSDDVLQASTVQTFNGSDAATLIVGFTLESLTTTRNSKLLQTEGSTSTGTIGLGFTNNGAAFEIEGYSVGSAAPATVLTSSALTAPESFVAMQKGDISADLSELYIDNSLVDSTTVDQGTGNYTNRNPLVGQLFNNGLGGRWFGGLLIGRALTTQEITDMHDVFNARLTEILLIDSASHAHASEQPTIASEATLAVDSATHAHSVESPVVTPQTVIITPNDSTHSHTAEQPTVTTNSVVAVNPGTHGHTAGSPTVTTNSVVTVDSGTHAHAADQPTITTNSVIAVNEAVHDHLTDQPTIATAYTVAPASGTHSHAADQPVVTAFDDQVLQAASDTLTGSGWVRSDNLNASPLWPLVDEGDEDWIQGYVSTDVAEVQFEVGVDPQTASRHFVRFRLSGDGSTNIVVRLRQGTTTIATWVKTNVPATPVTYTETLNTTQANAITNYADLRLRVEIQ